MTEFQFKEEDFKKLSPRQQSYFNVMNVGLGVLYICSKPGLAKSAIMRSIADTLDYQYIDIRLAMVDETDVGLFPNVQSVVINEDGTFDNVIEGTKGSQKVLDFVVPKWALKSNSRPTLIHFEEMNRASLQVRNAALQILLEREIGSEFKFNDNVLMCASGNLGEDDGTDVEEFDAALNNRLWHFKHDLTADEWVEYFAKANIHPLIVAFIKQYPEYMYKVDGSVNGELPKAYATPRTWHMLSEYLLKYPTLGGREEQMSGNFDLKSVQQVANFVVGNVVGTSGAKFIKYLDETAKFSIKQVIDDFKRVRPLVEKANRDKKSEILGQLKLKDFTKFSSKQVKNITDFLGLLDKDELAGFLTEMVDDSLNNDATQEPLRSIFRTYKSVLEGVHDMSGE